jgi:hypothetical protein
VVVAAGVDLAAQLVVAARKTTSPTAERRTAAGTRSTCPAVVAAAAAGGSGGRKEQRAMATLYVLEWDGDDLRTALFADEADAAAWGEACGLASTGGRTVEIREAVEAFDLPGKLDSVWWSEEARILLSMEGDHCLYCGKPRWLCDDLKEGLNVAGEAAEGTPYLLCDTTGIGQIAQLHDVTTSCFPGGQGTPSNPR